MTTRMDEPSQPAGPASGTHFREAPTEHVGFARIELPNAEVHYWAGFFAPDEGRTLFDALRAEFWWERHRVRIRGREVDCPRLSGWQGDATYSYSGLTLRPAPWTPGVTAVRRRIEAATGEAFNSVLANLYRDGNDRMGWHADDEPELGPAPVIASASFGAARRFLLRPKRGRARSVPNVLEPGSLLVMRGPTQRHWLHSLPPTRRPVGPRINFTFRRILA
ncbi:MAG: alpha-ketoglutarate-dependent dioxygenase AlkB [Immundisolibacterales bacterium]|nr:alpha-ketoglutarate-dependent dioxygenase AlkB [Immundisolibacterales bacterium]